MGKYAIVVPCSSGYVFGLNTLINQLDYYENTAEVHILWYGDPANETHPVVKEFFEKLPNTQFNFPVIVRNLNDFVEPKKEGEVFQDEPIWRITFSRWHYTATQLLDYDAVANTGADVMCTDNIMPWFDMVKDTDVFVTCHNVYGDWSCPWHTVNHTNSVTYADTPAICSPKAFKDMLDKGYFFGRNFIVADMPALFFALKQSNAKVVLLPDNLWVRNLYYGSQLVEQGNLFGKYYVIDMGTRMRVSMIHGKWWNKTHNQRLYGLWDAENAALAPDKREEHMRRYVMVAKNNIDICARIEKRFNTEHKLKLTWQDDMF